MFSEHKCFFYFRDWSHSRSVRRETKIAISISPQTGILNHCAEALQVSERESFFIGVLFSCKYKVTLSAFIAHWQYLLQCSRARIAGLTVSNFLIWKVALPHRVYNSSGNFKPFDRLSWEGCPGKDAADMAMPLLVPTLSVTNSSLMHHSQADKTRRHDCTVMCSKVLTFFCMHVVQKGKEKTFWRLTFWGAGRKDCGFAGFLPPLLHQPPTVWHQACFPTVWISGRQTWAPDWFMFCLAIIFYLSITCCTLLLCSQALSWHRRSLKQLWKLLTTPAWGFRPFSLNIYIGTTCWNMQVYTEKALKLEKTASSTSFIYLFSCWSREGSQNTGLEGDQT